MHQRRIANCTSTWAYLSQSVHLACPPSPPPTHTHHHHHPPPTTHHPPPPLPSPLTGGPVVEELAVGQRLMQQAEGVAAAPSLRREQESARSVSGQGSDPCYVFAGAAHTDSRPAGLARGCPSPLAPPRPSRPTSPLSPPSHCTPAQRAGRHHRRCARGTALGSAGLQGTGGGGGRRGGRAGVQGVRGKAG